MVKLGVNIDHVATVRQARKADEPDPVWAAVEAELGGADYLHYPEARDRYGDVKPLMLDAARKLNARRVLVTRGAQGSIGYDAKSGFAEVPALATVVKDRMGAGDTFLSAASICAVQDAPVELIAFIGNAAGAQAVATVGHRQTLQLVPLIRHIECLLK